MLPPDHVVAPVTSTVPLPPNVPLLRLKLAADSAPLAVNVPPEIDRVLRLEVPDTVSAPADTARLSFEINCPATNPAALTVTIGLEVGRSMNTTSVATGSVLLFQLAATFQNSVVLESLTQTFTFWNTVPRCRNMLPPTVPVW